MSVCQYVHPSIRPSARPTKASASLLEAPGSNPVIPASRNEAPASPLKATASLPKAPVTLQKIKKIQNMARVPMTIANAFGLLILTR